MPKAWKNSWLKLWYSYTVNNTIDFVVQPLQRKVCCRWLSWLAGNLVANVARCSFPWTARPAVTCILVVVFAMTKPLNGFWTVGWQLNNTPLWSSPHMTIGLVNSPNSAAWSSSALVWHHIGTLLFKITCCQISSQALTWLLCHPRAAKTCVGKDHFIIAKFTLYLYYYAWHVVYHSYNCGTHYHWISHKLIKM